MKAPQEDLKKCRKPAGAKEINVFIRNGWRFHIKKTTKWRIISVNTMFSLSICCFYFQLATVGVGLSNAAVWHTWRDATGFRRPAFHVINRFCLIPFQDWPSSKCFLWACYMMDAWDKSKNWGNIASGVRSDQRIWATVCSSVYPFLITTAQVPLSNSPMYPLDNEWQPGTM